MKLDWELKYYDFDAEDCHYRWHDIRMIALRCELEQYPQAERGDLLVTFKDRWNAGRILEHFNARPNFRYGSVHLEDGGHTVSVVLAPVGSSPTMALEPLPAS